MAEFTWDVQPYELLSELTDNYTRTVISTTINKAQDRAEEAEEWMKQNAPWTDRDRDERKRAEKRGQPVPDRHAREALSAYVITDPNEERRRQGMVNRARKRDRQQLARENAGRVARGLSPRSSIPEYRSAVAITEREIRVQRPILEIRLEHGSDIWYARWLEIARQGRWGIINKAIGHFAPMFMADIKQIAKLVQYNFTFEEEVVTESQRFAEHVESRNRRFAELGMDKRYEPWSAARQERARVKKRYYSTRKRLEREHREGLKRLDELEKNRPRTGTDLSGHQTLKFDMSSRRGRKGRK